MEKRCLCNGIHASEQPRSVLERQCLCNEIHSFKQWKGGTEECLEE